MDSSLRRLTTDRTAATNAPVLSKGVRDTVNHLSDFGSWADGAPEFTLSLFTIGHRANDGSGHDGSANEFDVHDAGRMA